MEMTLGRPLAVVTGASSGIGYELAVQADLASLAGDGRPESGPAGGVHR